MPLSRSWPTSKRFYEEACEVIPGGVNSPVRAYRSVDGNPLFITRAKGSRLWDADSNEYIDYVGSWGPAIVGHAHPQVLSAITLAAASGISFGAPTELETKLARAVITEVPSIEMIRFVSSGTEACMSALRLARAFTNRSKIIKFEGCYHGHGDVVLVKAGSGAATMGVPDSPGVPVGTATDTLTVPYNDLGSVAAMFEKYPTEIAALILEPIVGNSGFIRPLPGFLEGLVALCKKFGALTIFDEVMTGFRVGMGGVQRLHDLKPDLTCLGKVIGGGMPLAAYGGRRDIMAMVAPSGPVYQAGTLSGNPVAVTCGLKTLELLHGPKFFEKLATQTTHLVNGFREAAKRNSIPFCADSEGGMFGFFFQNGPVYNFVEAKKSDVPLFKKFFWEMLKRGVYMAPSAFEAGFVSAAHTDQDIEQTVSFAHDVMKAIR
ncbi:MAG: glutamate-1-semialdehyde 2,1-aminomutase [Proteobacteria bacterium]|nr:glutamate-1-semialdehyde 2,1-aminomutase [Pseudomonadota bacterium]